MTIPDYQTLMLPLLRLASDQQEHRFREAVDTLAEKLKLTEVERSELLPSGQQPVFNNRVGWARTYMKQAGLLDSSKRGFFRITDSGLQLLATNPNRIDLNVLERYPEFIEFKSRRRSNDSDAPTESTYADTPEDALSSAYQTLRNNVEVQLLDEINQLSPSFFERLVVDLLLQMGYGGNKQEAGRALGQSGDGGIDGVIDEDRLGLDVIYIQAKRWEGTVGRPEIQKFAGALQGHRARKGVFMTTSNFSKEAREYVQLIESRVILVDGKMLTRLMYQHNVGVSLAGVYEIKKIDSDYFTED